MGVTEAEFRESHGDSGRVFTLDLRKVSHRCRRAPLDSSLLPGRQHGWAEGNGPLRQLTLCACLAWFSRWPQVDRAICEKEEDAGYYKIMYCSHHKVHGATIVCQRAGELINELALCMHQDIKVGPGG